jgi:hypothetical protein
MIQAPLTLSAFYCGKVKPMLMPLLLVLALLMGGLQTALAQCISTSSYGNSIPAPAPGASISFNQITPGQYATVTGVVSSRTYTLTSSTGTVDNFTVTYGTPDGGILASGFAPYYLHVNFQGCTPSNVTRNITMTAANPGCTNATSIGTVAAPAPGLSATFTGINAGVYGTMTGAVAGQIYSASSTVATDYITIRQNSPGGAVVAVGTQPLAFVPSVAGTYYYHLNTNAACGTQASARNLVISAMAPACTNTAFYSAKPAPLPGASVNWTFFQPGEYAEITNAAAGQVYTASSTITTYYFTIRQGTPGGAVIAAGFHPLAFVAPAAGSYFIHMNTNAACGTSTTSTTSSTMTVSASSACNSTTYGGSFTAPAPGASATDFSNYAGEYTEMDNTVAGSPYTVTSSIATDYITVRQGSNTGAVIATGTQPLAFTATVAGTYFILVHTSNTCGFQTTQRNITVTGNYPVCANTAATGTAAAPAPGGSSTISNINAGQYGTLTGVTAGRAYTAASSATGDYITIRQGSATGTLVVAGTQPVNFTAAAAGTYYVHVNTNANCGAQSTGRTITISTPAPACTNTTPFSSIAAPATGSSNSLANVYANEYTTLTGAVAGRVYITSSTTTTDYISIRQGSYNGAVVAAGTQPVTFTAAAAGNYYIHVNTNSSCGTQGSGRTITVSATCSPNVSAAAASNSPVCAGNTLNLTASGGVSYAWTGPNGFTSTAQNPVLTNSTVARSGVYTVSITNAQGCSAPSSVTVAVNAAVSLAISPSSATICAGQSTTLTASGGSTSTVSITYDIPLANLFGFIYSCGSSKYIDYNANPGFQWTDTGSGTVTGISELLRDFALC